MTTPAGRAQIIRVKVEEDEVGLFYATSPDLRGLLVGRPDLDTLFAAIPQAITDLYAAKGAKVAVTIAKNDDPDFYPWVAIPAEVAERLLVERNAQ